MKGLFTAFYVPFLVFSVNLYAQQVSNNEFGETRLSLSVDKAMPRLEKLYLHFHQHPELSYQEQQTAKIMAETLSELGVDVTSNVGGYGVVGVYENGDGPTLLIRTDLDALPVTEQTQKPYASKVTQLDKDSNEVGVMHACGHDIHMVSLIGTAEQLIHRKQDWQGTLVLLAQPAEEVGGGAKAMLEAGIFSDYPIPDYILALHVSADMAAGQVGITSGYALANVDSVDIRVKGVGGHGAYPQLTIDPIVLASRMVLALQTIASREISPLEPNVMTVGSIQGGTKHNIIPNEVKLALTLRSYNPEVRLQQIASLKRMVKGIAMSAGVPNDLAPVVFVHEEERIPSTYNDPALTAQVSRSIAAELGSNNVLKVPAVMAGEDFGLYGQTKERRPISLFWLGAVNKGKYANSVSSGEPLPSLHSSQFAPDYPITIHTGVRAMTASAIGLFNQ
ncbi:M20 metallopeptidase family protein [Shewanella surugensis]|uniref:Amidohydrolase n=1 Tax=Shewanella surugensis TaxID=212020 RepID=A0ABT0L7Y3_9GAMM|nr:amidohydrolase [Shewanella surugensis]MCL1123505.1 amidohydrolase [Shewanella surugensis]